MRVMQNRYEWRRVGEIFSGWQKAILDDILYTVYAESY